MNCRPVFIVFFASISFLAKAQAWEYLTSDKRIDISQLNQSTPEGSFSLEETINLGFEDREVWFWTSIDPVNKDHFLVINNFFFIESEFYRIDNNGNIIDEWEHEDIMESKHTYGTPFSIIKISPYQDPTILVFKMKSNDAFILSIPILEQVALTKYVSTSNYIDTSVLGIVIALSVLYFIIFLSLRERTYLYYSVYSFFIIFSVLKVNGFFSLWFTVIDYVFIHYSALIETSVSISMGLFTLHFLRLKKYLPVINKVVWVLILNAVLASIICLAGYNQFAVQQMETGAMIFILTVLPSAGFIWYRYKSKSAKYYLISFLFLSSGAILYILGNYGAIEKNSLLIHNALELGIALEMIFLAIGVSKRIDQLRTRLIHAQQENIDIISSQNEKLEQLVQEKTSEITQQNQELRMTLNDLKSTQYKLIDSEKQATMGMLTAGLAHEMNNPLNFIRGNSINISKNLKEIQKHLRFMEQLVEEVDDKSLKQEMQQKLEKIRDYYNDNKENLSELNEENISLAEDIISGSNRIIKILKQLRFFRSDTLDRKAEVDLKDTIDSVLGLLSIHIEGKINVRMDVPHQQTVFCIPSNMVKILINVILNAVQSEGTQSIEIAYRQNGSKECELHISDDGAGVPDHVLEKVFEPFFTTKDHNVGMGLTIAKKAASEQNTEISLLNNEKGGATCILKMSN